MKLISDGNIRELLTYVNNEYVKKNVMEDALSGKAEIGTSSTTAFRGDYGQIAYSHALGEHAPLDAQKNSDITKEEIESKLTGDVSSHTHNQYTTKEDLSNKADKSEIHTHSNLEMLNGLTIKFWTGSLDDFNAIKEKDALTLYIVF